MTESIFVPFVIDSEDGARKVLEVLESKPAPPKSDTNAYFLTQKDAYEFFENRKK